MTIRTFEGITPAIDPTAWVDPLAVVIGNVTIGPESSLWPGVVARGDVHSIRIGARTNIQDGTVLHVTHPGRYAPQGHALAIGDGVTVGHRVLLHGCAVGDGCLIGMASTVMDGAVLGPRLILGAGSLVPPGKQLEGGFLWLGNPVRRGRPLTEADYEALEYAARTYVELRLRHGRET